MNARSHRNIALLSLALALGMSGSVMTIATASVVGAMLHAQASFATLPVAFLFGGTMCATVPAALLMARIGRRRGFLAGTGLGLGAAAISVVAILEGSFWGFCAGLFLQGASGAFVQQYRFAAAETVAPALRPIAIALVMAGGLAAAVIGPNVASWSRELIAAAPFAGCFMVLALLQTAMGTALWFLDMPQPADGAEPAARRPLGTIMRQPNFIVAATAATLSYAVMNYMMTPTPLAMIGHGHHFEDAMFVIEWHVLGMYAPVFAAGFLISRIGAIAVMALGVACYAASIAAALGGTALIAHFWTSSVLLGIGWSFCFVGATALLTETHRRSEAGVVQGINDCAVFTTVVIASSGAGWIFAQYGWHALNAGAIPAVCGLALAIGWLASRRPAVPSTSPVLFSPVTRGESR